MAIEPEGWVPPTNTMIHTDMRMYFLKMVELTNEMYRKRKSEYVDQDTEARKSAYEFAKAANAATMRVRRNSYKEWCTVMDRLLEYVAKRYETPLMTVCSANLTEADIVSAQNELSVEAKIKLAGYVEQILGQMWFVDLMHKNFISVMGVK